uniref:Uncharacterized protein n=1 Tax=Ackermannviridae sp. TaxID=2831612 RepID=A0A8S5VLF6_9CAUD|nr:MAG TPA: hypothetical protein [Ackermannviridae sp.]
MLYQRHRAAGDSSINFCAAILWRPPIPPSAGQGRVSEDGAGRSEKGFSPDFFQKSPPIGFTPPPLLKRVVLEKNIFSPFTTIVVLRP